MLKVIGIYKIISLLTFCLQTELYWSSLAERTPTVGGATGTAAWRAWRTRALATQLPKQDLSLAHCRNIDESHHKQFEDFVAARNEIALDIGLCCHPARPASVSFRRPAPCNSDQCLRYRRIKNNTMKHKFKQPYNYIIILSIYFKLRVTNFIDSRYR